MGFAFDTPNNPYKDPMTEADIDAWWASHDATLSHWWDDAHGYILRDISSRIPKGHTIEHGVNDSKTSYYLTISGPNINKSWT